MKRITAYRQIAPTLVWVVITVACSFALGASPALATTVPKEKSPFVTGASVARALLASAPLPPHTRPSTHPVTPGLDTPGQTPGVAGVIDIHELRVTSCSVTCALADIGAHPGYHATSSGVEGEPHSESVDTFVLGPNHLPTSASLEQLVYSVAADGSGSQIRVDAQVVWTPPLPISDRIPTPRSAVTTVYAEVTVVGGGSDPHTSSLTARQAEQLAAYLNDLPAAPAVYCMEDPTGATATFTSADGLPSVTATFTECEATVVFTEGSRTWLRTTQGLSPQDQSRLTELLHS